MSAAAWASRVQFTGGCWLWTGYVNLDGYGACTSGGRTRPAHQVVWETVWGPWPDGLEADHLCRVRRCVNPAHIEPVTHAENVRRGDAGRYLRERTHCVHGHEFTAENTGISRGKRYCRECSRARYREWHHRVRKFRGRAA